MDLLCPRSPSAITRLVMAIAVNAVNGQSCRSFAHIGNEICKRMPPTFANLNAAPTIAVIVRSLRIVTSTTHVDPRLVSRGLFTDWRVTVLGAACNQLFQFQATTRLRASITQDNANDHFFRAAFATTTPES